MINRAMQIFRLRLNLDNVKKRTKMEDYFCNSRLFSHYNIDDAMVIGTGFENPNCIFSITDKKLFDYFKGEKEDYKPEDINSLIINADMENATVLEDYYVGDCSVTLWLLNDKSRVAVTPFRDRTKVLSLCSVTFYEYYSDEIIEGASQI